MAIVNPPRAGMSSERLSISTSHSVLRPQLLSPTTPTSVRLGAERIPIAAIGHMAKRASGVGEPTAPKESMNCKSCRKKKIKCNRIRPSCGACLAFQCACIYDAIPKKRGPKTEVLEELLKRVSGLEKKLEAEKEANKAKKLEDIKAGNSVLQVTESVSNQRQPPKSPANDIVQSKGVLGRNPNTHYERSDTIGATSVKLQNSGVTGRNHDNEPPPYASLSPAPSDLIKGVNNLWTPLIKSTDSQPSSMKRRKSDAETLSEIAEPAEIPPLKRTRCATSQVNLESPEHLVHHRIEHPDSYIDAFFRGFHGKPHEILHEETFRVRLAQGTIHPSQLYIVCAFGAKYMHNGLRGHSLCVQFTEAARAAVDTDFPSFENFQTLLLIGISYFYLGKGFKTFMVLGIAVRMAYGLNLTRELPPNDPATPVEREVRRRAFWTCYLLDRFSVCGSKRPPMLLDESILLKLPSSMPQMRGLDEQFFSSHMGLAGTGAGQLHIGGLLASRGHSENASALCIDITKLLGTTVRYIEQGGVKGDIHFPWHPQSNLTKIQRELDQWEARTRELYAQTPGAVPGDALYLRHPDVTLLVMAKAIFHLVSCLVYRPFLAVELAGNSRRAHQGMGHGPEVDQGGQQQTWQAEATKMCFVHANAIVDLVEVLKRTKPEGFQWPAILGYCVVTAATIHLHGAHYQNTERDPVMRTSKEYFDRGMEQLRHFHDIWPAARVQYVMLRRLKKAHEELVQRLAETINSGAEGNDCGMGITVGLGYSSGTRYWAGYTGKQNIFQLDDFFQRYPNMEMYFDGVCAQCPLVEDMTETAINLSSSDELEQPDASRLATENKMGKVHGGFSEAPRLQAFMPGGGDSRNVQQNIHQQQQQYAYPQTYPTSNKNHEKGFWDPNPHVRPDNTPPSETTPGAFDCIRKGEVHLESSYPASLNSTQHALRHMASYSSSNLQLSLVRGTCNDPLDSQETLHSAEVHKGNWFSREHSCQNLMRNQTFGISSSGDVHSGNPKSPHGGGMHTDGYSNQEGIYIDHPDQTPMNIGTPSNEIHIRSGILDMKGAHLRNEHTEQTDPFLLMLAQIVEERNNNYANLSPHMGSGGAPGHMGAAFGSDMINSEASMLHTDGHLQPMGAGLHFSSRTQIDPTRPTEVNMVAGMGVQGYGDSWMHY